MLTGPTSAPSRQDYERQGAPTVQILLATYNGAAYLEQLLDSLFSQTAQDFEVLVADDGSTDGTMALLEAAVARHTGRLRIMFRDRVGSAPRNFMRLVGVAEAPYVMFCDQDDVWLAHKVETTMAAMLQMEARRPSTPVLVHTDLQVVDEALRRIHPSLMAYQRIDCRGGSDVKSLLCQNYVTGCTMMVNRILVQRVRKDAPDDMLMHDWWFALVAAVSGVIVYSNEATALYRQHGTNVMGGKPPSASYFARRVLALIRGGTMRRHLLGCSRQARALIERHGSDFDDAARRITNVVASLDERGPVLRRYLLLRHRLLGQGSLRNIATWLSA